MPVHKHSYQVPHGRADLVEEISRELLADSRGQPGTQGGPEIYLDETMFSDLLHVTIIWPKWSGVPETQRAAIILDAFAKAGRQADAKRIAIALGLTPEEADAHGVAP